MGTTEWVVVILVVGARLFLPFLIPYWPLPAASDVCILDSIDQSIFQQFPSIPLDGYQSYDKALDVYYLSVIYLSTLRNWTNQRAFRMGQFLYYYRMVGVVIFEMTQKRAFLFIFPNTFEYFFLFVEAVRLGWNTDRMGKWTVILSAAGDLDLHQAAAGVVDPHRAARHDRLHQGDAVRGDATDSWAKAIANRPWVLVLAIVIFAVLGDIVYWIITRKAPKFDHEAHFKRRPAAAAAARRGAVPQGPRRDQHLRLGAQGEDRAHGHRLHHLRADALRWRSRVRCGS